MGKKEVRGTRIRETREDRVFNAINMAFWIVVLFLVLYPPVADCDCVRVRSGRGAGGGSYLVAQGFLLDGL